MEVDLLWGMAEGQVGGKTVKTVIVEKLVFLASSRSIVYMVSGLVVLAHYYFDLSRMQSLYLQVSLLVLRSRGGFQPVHTSEIFHNYGLNLTALHLPWVPSLISQQESTNQVGIKGTTNFRFTRVQDPE